MERQSRRRLRYLALATVFVIGVGGFASWSSLNWRIEVLLMSARGRLAGMTWSDAIAVVTPGVRWLDAQISVDALLATGNPQAAVSNRFTSAGDLLQGQDLFRSHCAFCHGADGRGTERGPSFVEGLHDTHSDFALFRKIERGIPGTGMPGTQLDPPSAWRLAAFVQRLAKGAGPADSDLADIRDVTFGRLLDGELDRGNWLHYSGSYDGKRHSPLTGINRSNVHELGLSWALQLETRERKVETTPLVVDGIMYLTEPPNNVLAVDAATGQRLWSYSRRLPPDMKLLCCGLVNRGVAVLDDLLFLGTLDAHLVALDARTGRVRWDVEVADYREGHSITAAPLALRNAVVTGVAGAEYGIRGFLDAYDSRTGRRVWRFHTIPGPGEPGHETWQGESWRTGGAATWLTGTFDPEANLVYWGVANPAPLFAGEGRPGDNLYSNSVVAVEAAEGVLRWHFQFTPHDEHDWDANHIPVLVDGPWGGAFRKLLLMATKNAFFYVLDREAGRFLTARSFARQTWADGLDATGRPLVRDDSRPTVAGTVVWPGVGGATNWWSPSFGRSTGLFYVPFSEWPSVFYRTTRPMLGSISDPSDAFGSVTERPVAVRRITGVRALDLDTGDLRWEYLFTKSSVGGIGGVMSTGGGIVLAGAGDEFVALDDATGRELWNARLGGDIVSAPIAYLARGRQFITISAGNTVFTFERRRPPGTQ